MHWEMIREADGNKFLGMHWELDPAAQVPDLGHRPFWSNQIPYDCA